MITIQELLINRGLKNTDKIKLVRHKDDSRIDIYNVYRTDKGKFIEYQKCQSKDVFKDVSYIVSFIGEEGRLSRFVGVYKILSCNKHELIKSELYGGYYEYTYEMTEQPGFEDLIERVIIDWGLSALSWHQWFSNNKEVVEIKPGLHYKQFTDYLDFILDFDELKEIMKNEYSDWKKMLKATKGVYLITDTKEGSQYVGSAYGDDGIWGRWKEYVMTNGHGNNIRLKSIVESNPNYAQNFKFSVLMILPKTVTIDQAIKKENLFKLKLGSRCFGLNCN